LLVILTDVTAQSHDVRPSAVILTKVRIQSHKLERA